MEKNNNSQNQRKRHVRIVKGGDLSGGAAHADIVQPCPGLTRKFQSRQGND